jgi:dienelactone hydrolase
MNRVILLRSALLACGAAAGRALRSSALLSVVGCLLSSVSAAEPEANLFAYDSAAPLNVQETGRETRGAAVVRDLTFTAAGQPVKAYLVTPAAGSGPHAAILYVHWFGNPVTTNRTQFLEEAVALAGRGVVSLLVDAMWSRGGWWKERKPETDFAGGVQQVVELRRALDLLLAQPGVDPRRTALVAHDFGAMFGAVMGAADGRPKAYVFLAPTPRLSDWYLFNVKPASMDDYKRQLAPLDPIGAVAKLAPAPVFYQFATKDEYVPAPRPAEFYEATAPRKLMGTYEAGHDLLPPEVAADRVAWLARELGLK